MVQGSCGLLPESSVEADEGDVAHQDGEKIVEVVRNASREQAERLEFAGPGEFRLETDLAFHLCADQAGLLLYLPAQHGDPSEEQHGAEREDASEGEDAGAGPPRGRFKHG